MSKFLTKLTRPKLWDGYDFLLSAAIGEVEWEVKLTLKGYDVTGALLATNYSAAAVYTNQVISWSLPDVYGSFTGVSYITAWIETDLGTGVTGEQLTETLTIDVEEACANPILLIGRNSLGGALCWLFDVNQEYDFDYGDQIKHPRKTLFTNHLTANQWESLQDFITLGVEFRENITEFTSTTIKSHSRYGQQLYVVSSGGAKTGVISMPTRNRTFTKQRRHEFEIEIEYPEIFVP